jgi:phosphoenolpyruvate-protein kinase (PTS system EI component)
MLILGVDRDNYKVANIYDENNEAVLWALEKIITTCAAHGVTSSICGQAPSEYPELVEKLVDWGITSVSVTPDVIEKTREIVFDAEKKVLLNSRKYSNIDEKRKVLASKLNLTESKKEVKKIIKRTSKK